MSFGPARPDVVTDRADVHGRAANGGRDPRSLASAPQPADGRSPAPWRRTKRLCGGAPKSDGLPSPRVQRERKGCRRRVRRNEGGDRRRVRTGSGPACPGVCRYGRRHPDDTKLCRPRGRARRGRPRGGGESRASPIRCSVVGWSWCADGRRGPVRLRDQHPRARVVKPRVSRGGSRGPRVRAVGVLRRDSRSTSWLGGTLRAMTRAGAS